MTRDFHLPGRSPAIACDAMAATSHQVATQAAVEALRAGGTAADAAVTAVAVLSVVEPHMTGIGGDCFCIVAKPDAPIWGYNGSGRAASALGVKPLASDEPGYLAGNSVHAVTVPGAIEAWAAILEAHGRFGLDRALAPAIHYAEHGFPVAPRVAHDWALETERLRGDPGAARHYLPHGRAPAVGDVARLPALAATLKEIAARGPRAFYEGPIAEDIVATVKARGSFLSADDLSRHCGDVVEPIATNYRDLDVLELPPSGQGLTALVLLNVLENFDLAALDPLGPERFHLALEAARLAFAVRDRHLAEPSFMRAAVPALLDKAMARQLANRIDRSRRIAATAAPALDSDTVYLTVVDRDRMAVSLINSLFSHFGVGICTEKTGIVLHNRGACFVLDSAHPNCIGPGKRPMHTIIPAMAMRDGRCAMSFGVMGAHYQPMGHAQVVTNMVDYGMDVQAAIDAPRAFFVGAMSVVERGVPRSTIAGLEQRGHEVVVSPQPWGGGQAIQIDWDRGVLIGGSDPRKDGCALGY
ncbi:MAG: gamma-glutamyltransferase family protein [Xanthobacteraceae bacterium]